DRALRRLLDRVYEIRAEEQAGDVRVDVEGHEGSAGDVLTQASEGADLLIVGSRGHGGLAGLLFGSVSQACARHPRCPLLIVPPDTAVPATHGRSVAPV